MSVLELMVIYIVKEREQGGKRQERKKREGGSTWQVQWMAAARHERFKGWLLPKTRFVVYTTDGVKSFSLIS